MPHDHGHGHDHGGHRHGNEKDHGLKAAIRYIKIAPRMWKSTVNDAVVDLVNPRKGETVVDIGAGMGPALVRAAAAGASVVAVEPTPFMRRVMSTRRLFTKDRKHITIADGGAEALPLQDGEADAVWSVNTMHHWNDVAQGAAEIARVLGRGGRAVLVDENFADPRHPDSERWHERHDGNDHHGFSMVDAADMGDLMRAAGLVNIVAEERDMAGKPVIAVLAERPY